MAKPRFLLVVLPAHGHVNPALQLARRLVLIGCEVTFVTTVRAHRRMITKGGGTDDNNDNNFTPPNGMSFTQFSDGYDDGFGPKAIDFTVYSLELRSRGSQALIDLVDSSKNEGRPYTCMIYTFIMPWVADVAAKLGIPVALFYVQTATVFDLCYYYFHGYGDLIRDKMVNDRSCSLGFPGLPLDFAVRDLPSFLDASDSKLGSLVQLFQEQFDVIGQESQPKILVNTFDALEPEALRALCDNYKLNLIGIGPSINPVELRNSDDKNYKISKWLNSKPKGSVIYVSFGSIAVLTKPQMEEIAKGLLDFGRPFLWVIRENDNKNKDERGGGEEEEKVSFKEELEKVGKIVPWCCQVEVLSNNALGCFVTHCGWNSTLESLVCGVPVVAFPQSVDQLTNAKLIEDFWKTGVKVKANEEGIVEGQEIKRCLESVMGGEEMRRNAQKWRDLAWEASKDGGSSDTNLKAFVSDVIGLKTIS
ncbi:UDP-glycosyltransferase 75D1 [Morus notabilis]|uniref:Glycosyltransferase n=1 Tax=Morus notabilis TaxID=981085 RepID=W9RXU4_9ROSA|nr:crocetin glucosyltransferase, chloroplastic [Morus notabilis]EXB97437.1 UDP-glycosyltransferase 75D1 [Morus notabilis]